jgi:hypothetical protein
MSVGILRLIPKDPHFVPDDQARAAGLRYVSTSLPEAAEIKETVTPHVEFIDQGGNLEYIECPVCHQVLDNSWWSQVMDQIYDRDLGFAKLEVQTPCCTRWLSLNDLEYHWPAGFARYRMEARDPNGEFTDQHKSALEGILHCSLRKIWARY